MDWFSWLTKTGLEPSLVYEYGLAFANNELEEEDIVYFNHEFLQSMGISIAKHRLEILKLAKKEPKNHVLKHPISKLLFVLKKTKKSLTNYIATLVHPRDEDRAIIVVPNKNNNNNNSMMRINKGSAISYSTRWKRAMMVKNNRKLVMKNNNNNDDNQERLMITNGDYMGEDDHMVVSTPKLDTFSSPLMYDLQQNKEDKLPDDDHEEDVDDQYWSPTLEEIRWDAMFQDLKPT
ncbi:uncharacterized protein LOC141599698 [Silene latifolia]|uniref:uncharacterized protein LOC141599698 n=1 Tax=Silene latifolia TaxID=37657 RepID=UPI003D77339F